MKRIPLLLLAALGLFQARPAAAWGPEGHRIVAHIAERRLSESAREKLLQILPPEEQISDNYICNWPDYIRRGRPETGPWHFVDIPYDATNYDAAAQCPDGQCIVNQIDVFAHQLSDPGTPAEDRLNALKFVVHFLGDLHQPLHCADRDGDRGGNLRSARLPDKPEDTNLHSVWDMNLVRGAMGRMGALEFADRLNDKISDRQARLWARGTPADWAWESHRLAVQCAYAGVPPTGGPPAELDKNYVAANQKVVVQQLKKAGVRLARVLNENLRDSAPATL